MPDRHGPAPDPKGIEAALDVPGGPLTAGERSLVEDGIRRYLAAADGAADADTFARHDPYGDAFGEVGNNPQTPRQLAIYEWLRVKKVDPRECPWDAALELDRVIEAAPPPFDAQRAAAIEIDECADSDD